MNCPICNEPTETMQNDAKLDEVETDPCFFCGETSHHYINHDFGFDSIEEYIPCGISQLNIDRIKADIVPKIKQACLAYAATLQADNKKLLEENAFSQDEIRCKLVTNFEEQIRALKADKERLDWLEKGEPANCGSIHWSGHEASWVNMDTGKKLKSNYRSAIDEVRKETK